MLEDTYRSEMDALCPDAQQMDRLLAVMGEKRRKGVSRHVRTVLVAAAVVAALCVSALALSPTLREALASALGSFGPYSQTVEGASAADQGIEIRVVSAVVDRNLARIFLEVQDKTGDRLGGEKLHISAGAERTGAQAELWSINIPPMKSYDAESRTALFMVEVSGQTWEEDWQGQELPLKLTVYELWRGRWQDGKSILGEWPLSVTLERLGEKSFSMDERVEKTHIRKMILSPMSISVFTELDESGVGSKVLPVQLAVYLSDGRMIRGRSGGGVNHGGPNSDGMRRLSWAFDDAVDAEQVVGVAFGMWYVPVDGDIVGPGYWLKELP